MSDRESLGSLLLQVTTMLNTVMKAHNGAKKTEGSGDDASKV